MLQPGSASRPAGSLLMTAAMLAALLATTVAPVAAAPLPPPVNNPPTGAHSILVFPQRDFVSAAGYADGDLVVVYLIHPNGTIWSTDPANPIAPQAGVVEVNHPGGACWFGTTPDIRPGDVVQIDIVGGPNAPRADATTVANVTAQRPVAITRQSGAVDVLVHGTAVANDGVSQIPIAQLEQRLVANRDAFDKNGRRTLRATSAPGADGTLAYDGPGLTTWTASYQGLSAADVTRALGAESRGMWLGAAIAPALEGTIFEIGAAVTPGPAAPCTAPLEVLPPPPGSDLIAPSIPTKLTAAVNNANTVTLKWDPSVDNLPTPPGGVTSYGVYRDGIAITNVQNVNGSAPAPTTYVDRNVPPGTFTYTVDAADAVGNRSAPSAGATATATAQLATLPPGTVVHEPPVAPVQIIGFPSRDFISSSGFDETDTVDVQVIRNGVLVSTANGQIPQADPRAAPGDPFAGTVEVNHPGGGCWEGITPELRAGDIIRTIAYAPGGAIRTVDQTTVANVTAFRAVMVQDDNAVTPAPDGIVEVHGTAMTAAGGPIPLDQLDQRLVANRDLFDLNGRRTLRGGVGSDGVTVYDTVNNPTGVNWTTTYSGLTADDVARAVGGVSSSSGTRFTGAESRMLWLGSAPLALTELTIFENSDVTIPGPAAAVCFAPLEAADVAAPTTPATLTAAQSGPDTVALAWGASSDNWYVYGYRVFRDGQPLANVGGTVLSYTDVHVPPGTHTYTLAAFDSASPRGVGATIIDQLMAGFGLPYGNLSAQFAPPVPLTQLDVTPPTVPTNLVAVSGAGSASLTWTTSTDDVGVTEYGIYRDSGLGAALIATVASPATGYTDGSLASGTYVYTVDAADLAGNRSAQSASATANVTGVADVTPPSTPTGVAATTSPDIHGRNVIVSWTASTDDVGVTGYGIYRSSVQVPGAVLIATVNGTTLSFTDANLAAGTYAYTVDAVDSAANRSGQSAPPASAVVANDPPIAPHALIAFPARDFISATGYTPGAIYTFSLIRGGLTYVSAPFAADGTGLIEVNHPGGTCWNVNTPDMRPGDVIRITNVATGVADQTTVANVTAERPVATGASTVVIHGTAQDALGNPLPVAQIEQRLIANRDLFELNGRRTLRAASAAADGTLVYDAPGSINWTATYAGLSATDMVRAVGGTTTTGTVFIGAESRAIWLGRAPLALAEQTIFENGAGVVGGPSAPCTAPAETPVAAATFTPASLAFGNQAAVPPSTSAARVVTFSNGGGAAMTITDIYLAGLNPADFTIASVTPAGTLPRTLAAGASLTVNVTFSPKALGLRQANLSFSDNAANTTDQSVALTGSGIANTAPTISVSPASLAFGTVNGGLSSNQSLTVSNTGTGSALNISALSFTGTAAADFTRTGGTCTPTPISVAAGGSCTITVTFKPSARGARAATLTLTHNAAPTATSTAIPLSGTGGNGSVLSFNSNPVKFGTVNRNTTKDQTVSVKNSGNAAATLNLTSFTVTGTGYSLVSTTCATLAAGGSCSVIVRFTAPNTVATFNGTLSVFATNGFPTTVTTNLTATTK